MMMHNDHTRWLDRIDACPWGAVAGRPIPLMQSPQIRQAPFQLYTADERRRRDASPWTIVQGVLAPLQFAVFLISLTLVLRFVFTGAGLEAAMWSVVVKTGCLYAIMITFLFASAFFWEDVFSMLVIALHTLYLVALFSGRLQPHALMFVALAAYAAYAINAAQFVMKLRLARIQSPGVVG
jgi:3-vinyl bacteriochlorophyllide hydratase